MIYRLFIRFESICFVAHLYILISVQLLCSASILYLYLAHAIPMFSISDGHDVLIPLVSRCRINATVMGSKNAKDDEGAEGEHENADTAEHVEGAEAEVEKPEGEPTDKASAAEESKAEGGEKDIEMAAAEDQKAETEEKEKAE